MWPVVCFIVAICWAELLFRLKRFIYEQLDGEADESE